MQMNRLSSNLSLKSVLIGLAAGYFGAFLATILIFGVYGLVLYGAIGADAKDEMLSWQSLSIVFLISVFFAAVGGQVAAKVAGKGVFLNSGLVGVALAVIQIPSIDGQYVWYSLSIAILSIPAALVGGWNTISSVKVENA